MMPIDMLLYLALLPVAWLIGFLSGAALVAIGRKLGRRK